MTQNPKYIWALLLLTGAFYIFLLKTFGAPEFSYFTVAAITPVIVTIWGRLFPPSRDSEFSRIPPEILRRRNNWIDRLATVFCLAGIFCPLGLMAIDRSYENNWWIVGLGFGLCVILPSLFVMLATLPWGGFRRLQEFGRFYEVKWGIGLRGIAVVYVPLAALGMVSVWKLVVK